MYIGKAFDPHFPGSDLRFYSSLAERDITVLHLDEEGAVFDGDPDDWGVELRRRLDPKCLQSRDFVCTWGEFQRDVYRHERPEWDSHIRTTGHPRFDLYGSEHRAYYDQPTERLRARHGGFVLVNTNTSIANHGAGLTTSFSARLGYDVANPKKRLKHIRYWSHASQLLLHLVQLVARSSIEYPKVKFVIRPHPSEDRKFYETIFSKVPNVEVIHEGSVTPWLLAAEALVHCGCTTAIEARLAGIPIINYKPVEDPAFEKFLPGVFGVTCSNEEQAITALGSILARQTPAENDRPEAALARSLLYNLDGPAFPRLLDVIATAIGGSESTAGGLRDGAYRRQQRVATLIESLKQRVSPLFPQRARMRRYSRGKFQGFRTAGLTDWLERLERVTGTRLAHEHYGNTVVALRKE